MTQNAERKFYRIVAYTGTGETETEYISTKSEDNVNTHGQDMVNELAYYCASERFWHEAEGNESESDFLERYLEECGFEAVEISADEYKCQKQKIWCIS